jgi:hypothetical protein
MAINYFIKDSIYVKESNGKGLGVFAKKDIPANTVIECSPVLVFNMKDTKAIGDTLLYNYYFIWGDSGRLSAVILGYGSLYNHSYDPSCRYETDYEDKTFTVITRRAIKKGEEITFNYNFYPESQNPLWFDVKDKKAK